MNNKEKLESFKIYLCPDCKNTLEKTNRLSENQKRFYNVIFGIRPVIQKGKTTPYQTYKCVKCKEYFAKKNDVFKELSVVKEAKKILNELSKYHRDNN